VRVGVASSAAPGRARHGVPARAVHPETALRQAKSLLRRSQVVPVEMDREAELDAMLTLLDRADLST